MEAYLEIKLVLFNSLSSSTQKMYEIGRIIVILISSEAWRMGTSSQYQHSNNRRIIISCFLLNTCSCVDIILWLGYFYTLTANTSPAILIAEVMPGFTYV